MILIVLNRSFHSQQNNKIVLHCRLLSNFEDNRLPSLAKITHHAVFVEDNKLHAILVEDNRILFEVK